MKKTLGWMINLILIGVGGFLIFTYFQPETEVVSKSEPIIELLLEFNYDEAFRQVQQVSLNQDELNEVKDVLLMQTLQAYEQVNEERLILIKAFVNNVPFEWGSSFHMPILSNVQIYLDNIEASIILECHVDNHEVIVQLRRYTTRFIDSILPFYRNGLAQALNNARTHYNNALFLQEELFECYSPLAYQEVLQTGLSFMNETLLNTALSNFNAQRATFLEIAEDYDNTLAQLMSEIEIVQSRLNTLNLHIERNQERINAIQR